MISFAASFLTIYANNKDIKTGVKRKHSEDIPFILFKKNSQYNNNNTIIKLVLFTYLDKYPIYFLNNIPNVRKGNERLKIREVCTSMHEKNTHAIKLNNEITPTTNLLVNVNKNPNKAKAYEPDNKNHNT